MKRNKLIILIIAIVAICTLSLAFGLPRIETARALPTRNPTPTPTSPSPQATPPPQTDYSKVSANNGAYIELHTAESPELWAIVQWQDSSGNWRNVEGWQGNITTGSVMWWVSPRDFGKGPFRWTIYGAKGGEALAFSNSFDLPYSAEQIINVNVSLAQ